MGDNKSEARFHLRHPQMRWAIVGLAFLVEVAASWWLPMVGADDRVADPQAAAELAVRKRILANWQAAKIASSLSTWPGNRGRMIDRPGYRLPVLTWCASAVGGR